MVPEKISNVEMMSKANVYWDGKVTSRTFFEPDGQRKTLGFVCAGEYEFSTSTIEEMELYAGEFELMLPGETEYHKYVAGDTFTIPCGIQFKVRSRTFADYCCTYVTE